MDRSTGVVLFAVVAAFIGIAYGAYLIQWILKLQEGSDRMKAIAKAIQEGANAYLNRQYRTVAYVAAGRSEEHTSELQSRFDLVCRLLLEKKNKKQYAS